MICIDIHIYHVPRGTLSLDISSDTIYHIYMAKNTDLIPSLTHPPNTQPNRINIGVALEMRLKQGKTVREIAQHFGVSCPAVYMRMRDFRKLLDSPQAIQAYESVRSNLLTAVELKLIQELLTDGKLKDASANNLAYALTQVTNMRRLNDDKSTVNIAHKLEFRVVGHEDEGEEQHTPRRHRTSTQRQRPGTPGEGV